ncbi:MAG: PadR family transcriptional regulator [Ruminiclostridium sp.]
MSLQFAILGLLGYKSMTGYDLKKMFDQSISNFWVASQSQIYRELGTLENKGLLNSVIQPQNDRPDKKIYSVTETGKATFKEWIVNFPQKLSKETRDEFTLRIFFGSNLSKEELIKQFHRFKDEKLSNLEELKGLNYITEKYAKEMKLFDNEGMYWKFVLRRAYLTFEMLIDWVDECIEDLEK